MSNIPVSVSLRTIPGCGSTWAVSKTPNHFNKTWKPYTTGLRKTTWISTLTNLSVYPLEEGKSNKTISPSEEPIVYRDSLWDLGVIMSNDYTFRPHIQSVITKASRMVGWVLRTFKTGERQVKLTLYKQLLLSQLENCCPVWASTNVASIKAI
jgi:hypothetical protein